MVVIVVVVLVIVLLIQLDTTATTTITSTLAFQQQQQQTKFYNNNNNNKNIIIRNNNYNYNYIYNNKWSQELFMSLPNFDVNGDNNTKTSTITTNTGTTDSELQLSSNTIDGTITTDNNNTLIESTLDNKSNSNNNNNIFNIIAEQSAMCLYQSDLRRDANSGEKTNIRASTATNWIHDPSAYTLQQYINKLQLISNNHDESTYQWIRWIKSIPCPAIIDLSNDFRMHINSTILTDKALEQIDQKRNIFLQRLGCRLIVLPSGMQITDTLIEPSASIIYGKLLFGGVTRSRLLSKNRIVGQRTEIKPKLTDQIPAWMMYGGADRTYEAVDIGPAAVLEIILLPRGKSMVDSTRTGNTMTIHGVSIQWKPSYMFEFIKEYNDNGFNGEELMKQDRYSTTTMLSGRDRNEAFKTDFKSSVGGLQSQIDAIVRRVLDGRVIRPADDDGDNGSSVGSGNNNNNNNSNDQYNRMISETALEAQELELLGLSPVRGLLLYGPPGTGKTLLAREISRALRARKPKIVAAPELLEKWVGGSEKLVRMLFADAEAELAACNGDVTKSALHVIVIDEIDAVFRKRSSSDDSGEATRSSVVNQILAKLDGINSISNLLLIGMTNRKELLDDALLRPGRLEVQIEIPLPNKDGRREILQIHFNALRQKGRLSQPLCCAIDGIPLNKNDYNIDDIMTSAGINGSAVKETASTLQQKSGKKRKAIKRALGKLLPPLSGLSLRPYYDLASDSVTGGFSGADIAGLVRCAGSIALSRARKDGNGGVQGLLITLEDVKQALVEVKR